MELTRIETRLIKNRMRLPVTPYKSRTRYQVSVWLDKEQDWLEDMKFRYVEDARVHAARWNRIYGVTLTRIQEVEV